MTTTTERLTHLWEDSSGLWGWLTTVDHKRIGHRYLVTAMLFLIAGGVEAVLIRLQLAQPEQRLLTPEAYDQIFSMHGITMIFWYALPILTLLGKSRRPLSNAIGVHFTRGMSSVSLAFKRRMQDGFSGHF